MNRGGTKPDKDEYIKRNKFAPNHFVYKENRIKNNGMGKWTGGTPSVGVMYILWL